MHYTACAIPGAWIIDLQKIEDSRGYFAYLFESAEAQQHGIPARVAQVKLSYNRRRGTLRGMHYQVAPALETKIVRCLRGAVWDVIVDLRVDSPTFLRHVAVELSAENKRAFVVPPLCAHGYQTLSDDAEVVYQVDEPWAPPHERGVRFDDPLFAIAWPIDVAEISPKDRAWALLDAAHPRPPM